MLNLIKSSGLLVAFSLIGATSLFGASEKNSSEKLSPSKCETKCPPKPCDPPCPQPTPPTQICPGQDPCCPSWATPVLNAGYGYPAHTQIRCGWSIYTNVSFIYWQPIQENLELGALRTSTNPTTQGYNYKAIDMDFDYAPGFKVGMGGYFDYDNWDLNGEYTWFHTTQTNDYAAPSGNTIVPMRGKADVNGTFAVDFNRGNVYGSADESWNLKIDTVEMDLGRWYYLGTKLTIRPSLGGRVDWIRQDLDLRLINAGNLSGPYGGTADINVVKGKSRSWAIGPQVGLDSDWTIGYGFRLFGSAELDALFTKYTKASLSQRNYNVTTGAEYLNVGFSFNQDKMSAIRTHLDLELGFGWGTYFDCNRWYFDLSAGYDFQVYFDQNMFRDFEGHWVRSQSPNGSLFLQGLTLKCQLDY